MSTGAVIRSVANAKPVRSPKVSEGERGDGPPPEGSEQSGAPEWVAVMKAWAPALNVGARQVEFNDAVQGLIRAGKVGALVAAGGTGKTTILLILGVCHATRRKFFGLDVLPGTFVLMSSDDPQEDLDAALDMVVRALKLTEDEIAMVAQKVRLHSLQGATGTKVFTTTVAGSVHATQLDEWIAQAVSGIPDLVGIAIDTLRQFSGGSSNDEQVIKHTIAGATELARRTGAYVILPHHTGKQNYRDGVTDMYAGSGSAAIADNCRFVLLLQTTTWADIEAKVRRSGQERGDPLVLSSTRGSLLMKPAEPIYLHRDGFRIERVAGAVMTYVQQGDEKDRAVLRAVRRGAENKSAIYGVVGGNKSTALARVSDLEARGFLRLGSETGSAKYLLTSVGAKFLDADV